METSDAAGVANKVSEPAFIEENHTKEPSPTDLNNIESNSSTVPPEPEDNETQIEIQHPALQDNENKTQETKKIRMKSEDPLNMKMSSSLMIQKVL